MKSARLTKTAFQALTAQWWTDLHPLLTAHATERMCQHCHTPLPPASAVGRPRQFCSSACRQRASRRLRRRTV